MTLNKKECLQMFRKAILLGMILLLFSTVVSALDPVISVPVPTQILTQQLVLPVITPLQLKGADLLVEAVANIPENVKVGGIFWVDIYVTSASPEEVYSANIKLTSSNAAIADFVSGQGENGNLFAGTSSYLNGVYSHNSQTATAIKPLVRYQLGRLQMQAKAKGAFTVAVDKSGSSVTYFQAQALQPDYYNLVINPTIITKVADSVCVPITITCPEQACGLLPDGCGGVITCDCTACAAKHNCVIPAAYIFPGLLPEAGNKQLCEAAINSQGADRVVLQNVSAALKDSNSNKISKLSALIQVIKVWFAAP